jgi:predicted DNA-binding transcriptional regulator AlpA
MATSKTMNQIAAGAKRPGRKTIDGLFGYLSAREFAELTGLSRHTVYRQAGKSIPPLHDVAGSKRFRWDEVNAWQTAGEKWPLPTTRKV